MLFNRLFWIRWQRAFAIAIDNNAGKQVDYGDWFGFVQSCMDLDQRLQFDSAELTVVYLNPK